MIERVNLPRHPLLAQCFTERLVNPPKPSERLFIAEQVHDARLLLERRWNHHEELAACAEPRESSLEVLTDRIELLGRQQPVLECGVAEAAQQRTPMVVRAER